MIPDFPEFIKLDLSHRETVNDFFQKFPAYSEFGFANMFVWDTKKPVKLSLLNSNLVVQFLDFHTDKYYLTLLGVNKLDETVEELIKYAHHNDFHTHLSTIPEHVIQKIGNKDAYDIKVDQANGDYIISIPMIAQLYGQPLETKRQRVNHFRQSARNHTFRKLDLTNKDDIESIRQVIETWIKPLKEKPPDIIIEIAAIEKALLYHADLKLECFGVFVGNRLEAFTMIEKVHGRTVIGHFEKGNKEFTGIYEYMNHSLCKHLLDEGYEYLNICQDLGIDGLRSSKKSYRPVNIHKKYELKLKSGNIS